jgi:hypothetical protein
MDKLFELESKLNKDAEMETNLRRIDDLLVLVILLLLFISVCKRLWILNELYRKAGLKQQAAFVNDHAV